MAKRRTRKPGVTGGEMVVNYSYYKEYRELENRIERAKESLESGLHEIKMFQQLENPTHHSCKGRKFRNTIEWLEEAMDALNEQKEDSNVELRRND